MTLTKRGKLRAHMSNLAMILDLDGSDRLVDEAARRLVDAIEEWARGVEAEASAKVAEDLAKASAEARKDLD